MPDSCKNQANSIRLRCKCFAKASSWLLQRLPFDLEPTARDKSSSLRDARRLQPAEVERHRDRHLDRDDDEEPESDLAEDDQCRERALALLLDLEQVVELLDELVLVPRPVPLPRPA